jgi:putative phosphonate metabolism protein
MTARYAIYVAPTEDTLLWHAACRWLGRNPRTEADLTQPEVAGFTAERIRLLTASPRLYGFHGTLKPPFRLATGCTLTQLADAARELAVTLIAFSLPPLELAPLDGFLALRPAAESAQLQGLAETCVAVLDCFRAPPDVEELARRRAAGLSMRQEELMARFGYPYVFDQFRFHLTLTERLEAEDADGLRPWLTHYFAESLTQPLRCEGLCLFAQDRPGEVFRLLQRFPLKIG